MGNSQLPMSKMASETAHEGNLFRGAVKQNAKCFAANRLHDTAKLQDMNGKAPQSLY